MSSFKTLFGTLLLALLLSNVFNSVMIALHQTSQTAPSYIGTGVQPPKPATASGDREDSQFGDIWITDKQESPTNWTEKVTDKPSQTQIAFPTSW